ncbi:CDP-diacylglycerol--serine O-phosphatidyltransferase [Pararhizobium sp. IMCC21322]|uniref:CDP-diacylglycerol--serine O-phosphatidyltransferase n=1 Tax=Pararhizobium sp. IMCC21322 TaxID=3067903 RepID=UPI00274223CD|nr:CDP-diacylglycerol--serine O-phosphatidyltransferase [Pararhizobium sp. IMCC21322]
MSGPFQPLDPDDKDGLGRNLVDPVKKRPISLRAILPNMVTLLALCAGLTSIRLAMEGRFEFAIFAMVLAAVLDGLDGRVARLLKSSSKLGAELDSLTDFVNFGVAPGMILYLWLLHDLRSLGWIAALVFAICMALRLARFNVANASKSKRNKSDEWQDNYFTGVPAPAGAMCALLPLSLQKIGVPIDADWSFVILIYVLCIGFLVVSTVPTFSGKKLGSGIPRDFALPLMVGLVLWAALLASYPFTVVTIMTFIYLGLLPVGIRSFRKKMAAEQQPPSSQE